MKILYVEDDKYTALTVRDRLKKDFLIDIAASAEEADYLTCVNVYDVIILDVLLPGISGIQLCQNLRKNGIKTYIIMLSGKNDIENKISALNGGADDYLTKPFDFDELIARIRALMRRQNDAPVSHMLTINNMTIDTLKKTVTRNNTLISLRRKEYDILEYLVRNPGKIITRGMILDHVWDSTYDSLTNTVDVHIKHLRDRIDKPFDKKLIKTVYGLGYRLEA